MKLRTIIFWASSAILINFLLSCNATIDISKYPVSKAVESSYLEADADISLSLIETGYAHTREAFLYKGGGLLRKRKLSHIAVLLQHPKGNFLFDTGLGSEIDDQFNTYFSFFQKRLFKYEKTKPVREILRQYHFSPENIHWIIVSHLHWDHASGINDFPDSEIWTVKEEYENGMSNKAQPPAFVKPQYDTRAIRWNFVELNPIPYEVFEKSYDIFGDGSAILVEIPGHTKGSLGLFVNLKSGGRYFFTGDTTWAMEGFEIPAEKHPFAKKKVDGNVARVKEAIVKIHHLIKEKPEIRVVPAHDYQAQKNIAHFPEVEQ